MRAWARRRGGRGLGLSGPSPRLALLPLVLSTFCAPTPGWTGTRPPVRAERHEPAVELSFPGRPGAGSDEPDAPEGVFHQVEPGQTLWRIARAYGVDWAELARVNRIVDPKDISVGRVLFVPGARISLQVQAYPAPPPSPRQHPSSAQGPAPPPAGGFIWPVTGGEILSSFGAPRRGHRHAGIDIRGVCGQAVLAAGDGEVVYSGDTLGDYGKMVILAHGGDLQSVYAHNSELLVQVGDRVMRGQPVARVGRTGNASTDHCHFEVRKDKVPADPMLYFTQVAAGTSAHGPAIASRDEAAGERDRGSAAGSGEAANK